MHGVGNSMTSDRAFAIYAFGLIAGIFLSVALRTPDRQLLVEAAMECLTVLPLAFIYWRKLEG